MADPTQAQTEAREGELRYLADDFRRYAESGHPDLQVLPTPDQARVIADALAPTQSQEPTEAARLEGVARARRVIAGVEERIPEAVTKALDNYVWPALDGEDWFYKHPLSSKLAQAMNAQREAAQEPTNKPSTHLLAADVEALRNAGHDVGDEALDALSLGELNAALLATGRPELQGVETPPAQEAP